MASLFMAKHKLVNPDIEIIREKRRKEMEERRMKNNEMIKEVDERIKRDTNYVNELKEGLLTENEIQEINKNIESLKNQSKETYHYQDKAYIDNDISNENKKLRDNLNKLAIISDIEGYIEDDINFIKKSLNKTISSSKRGGKKRIRKSKKVIKKNRSKKFNKAKSKKAKSKRAKSKKAKSKKAKSKKAKSKN
tara:strand:- start:102 stop:680 length:579 start_codon:yes stop_codon:yes gene_type:complete